MVAKNLKLKANFLAETDAQITADLKYLIFNYYYLNENNVEPCELCYDISESSLLNNNKMFKSISLNDKDYQKCSEFLIYSLDNSIPKTFDMVEQIAKESLIIFDDIFDALAFYQQTKLPTIVIKLLTYSNNSFKEFCSKLNQHFNKVN